MGEMMFSLKDLYPNLKTTSEETSVKANPETDDQVALNEDVAVAEKSDQTNASRKNVFLAIVIMIALVVFFGGK